MAVQMAKPCAQQQPPGGQQQPSVVGVCCGHRDGSGPAGVDDKTNGLGVIEDLLLGLALRGRLVTTDALLKQRTVAVQIVEQGGDYVLPVKEDQPLTYEAIAYWSERAAPYDWPDGEAHACEEHHGRLTQWKIVDFNRAQ